MSETDAEYYRRRAREERGQAKHAKVPDAAVIHEELARQYEALVKHPDLRPKQTG